MSLDHEILLALRKHHPAWRLLCSDHAPMVAAFLDRVFVTPNVRLMRGSELTEALEDELFALRQRMGEATYPKSAGAYLDEWAGPEKGWLRKFYVQESDEPHFDLTPATEKAIAWLDSLAERSFVGTESRLLTLFELLRQMSEGSEADPVVRIAELEKRRSAIEAEIARIESGDVPLLDDTALKDRFQQFVQVARELLTDFREVEQNFRGLDRRVRERIAQWEGGKGELLEEILGEREAIADSDQGRSFRGFWEFLMSSSRQEELDALLDRVLDLPAIAALGPDERTRRVHYDWLEAGEHTQRTVAQLSQQLRRFLDDRTWLENRRIVEILRSIEKKLVQVQLELPTGTFFAIDSASADITLPMEKPLHVPKAPSRVVDLVLDDEPVRIDASALFTQFVVDRSELVRHVDRALQERSQITLAELVESRPLDRGLAELIAYLDLGSSSFAATMDESQQDTVQWRVSTSGEGEVVRKARLPRVIFVRQA